jgi:hypothetical protein
MNDLTGLIPILYLALQVVSRELVGFIPATSSNMSAKEAAKGQTIRIPVTPTSENLDITPGTPPTVGGTDFEYVDMMITKSKIARPIVWNGEEQLSVGNQYNQMLINQFTQAMRSLTNEVERDVCFEGAVGAASGGNVYGTAGTTPFATNLDDMAEVKKRLDDVGTPLGDRHLILNTAAGASLRKLEKLTNVNQAGENTLLRQGVIHELMGFAIRESGGFLPVSGGTTTSVALSGAATKGSRTLAVTAITGNLAIGAVINLAGDYYAITAPAAAGATTISIAPKLKKDVASGTSATVLSTYLPNVAFSRDFIYTITRAPAMPKDGDAAKDITVITDPVSGLSFQVALYGDYRQSRIEIGLAWGVKAVNAEHGLLLLG